MEEVIYKQSFKDCAETYEKYGDCGRKQGRQRKIPTLVDATRL